MSISRARERFGTNWNWRDAWPVDVQDKTDQSSLKKKYMEAVILRFYNTRTLLLLFFFYTAVSDRTRGEISDEKTPPTNCLIWFGVWIQYALGGFVTYKLWMWRWKFPVSKSCVTISNHNSLSSSETGLNPEIRSWKSSYLIELDVRKPLVVSISQRIEELRLYNLV